MNQREDLIATHNARVAEIILQAHEQSPWHYHTKLTESVFCLHGHIEVQCGHPASTIRLSPGERYDLKPKVEHRVRNPTAADASYLLVQNGSHDFIEIDRLSPVMC